MMIGISNTFLLQYLSSVSLVVSFSSVIFPTDDRNEKIDSGFQSYYCYKIHIHVEQVR